MTERVHDHLLAQATGAIGIRDLGRLTHASLKEEIGPEAAQRFVVWEQYRHSNRPLIVVVGGTAGSGKSTVSSRLAHLLDIVRIQSTDMLREVMRGMIPQELLPVLHTSSFLAWNELPATAELQRDQHAALVELVEQRLGDVGRGRGDDDRAEGRELAPPVAAVEDLEVDVLDLLVP